MSEQFSPHEQEPTFSRIEGSLYDEPSRQEKPTFSTRDANREALDVEIVDEETFGPSRSVEPHSGEIRVPGIHEATILTDEGLAQLHEDRAKEDHELEKAHQEKIDEYERKAEAAAKERARATMGEAVVNFLTTPTNKLESNQDSSKIAPELVEKFPRTVESISVAITLLPNYDTNKMAFERILENRGTPAEIDNLRRIRKALFTLHERAKEEGKEFTPKMAMDFYQKSQDENAALPFDKRDHERTNRYYTVKGLYKTNPNALKAFMGLSAEEINNQEAA